MTSYGVLDDERVRLEHDVFGVLHDRINHIADTTLADGALSHAIRVFLSDGTVWRNGAMVCGSAWLLATWLGLLGFLARFVQIREQLLPL